MWIYFLLWIRYFILCNKLKYKKNIIRNVFEIFSFLVNNYVVKIEYGNKIDLRKLKSFEKKCCKYYKSDGYINENYIERIGYFD